MNCDEFILMLWLFKDKDPQKRTLENDAINKKLQNVVEKS